MSEPTIIHIDVPLAPKAETALDHATQIEGHSKEVVINRAIQLYDYLATAVSEKRGVWVTDPDNPDYVQEIVW